MNTSSRGMTHLVQLVLKRVFDILVSAISLVLLSPLIALIALAIKLDDGGPVFFVQERAGKDGKPFRCVKFRTMVVGSETTGLGLEVATDDERITRVGRFLRKTRLDEFPQFLNILRGEMSTVGPRPERPEFVQELEKKIPFYRLRHAVKPGMAGWAMIHQDYAGSIEDSMLRLQYDLYYVKHQSLWLDALILLRTLGKMVRLRGR